MEQKILTELAGMLEDINPSEIVSHILDGTLLPWLENWKMKCQMLVRFLTENNRLLTSEDLSDLTQFGAVKVEKSDYPNRIEK